MFTNKYHYRGHRQWLCRLASLRLKVGCSGRAVKRANLIARMHANGSRHYNMHRNLKDHEQHRKQILDAAEGLFRVYGLGKTTMAEIADTVDMSAANLYRYFENKHDLAEECAWRIICVQMDKLREVVRQPATDAGSCLHKFVLTALRQTYELAEETPKLDELIEYLASHFPDLIPRKMKIELTLITEILSQGNDSGVFDIDDTVSTARAVHTAIALFETPCLIRLYSIDQLKAKAYHMVELLLNGLQSRQSKEGKL